MDKVQVDKYITVHYSELMNVLQGMLAKKNLVVYANDLFSNAYLYVTQLQQPIKDETELRRIFINYAKKQIAWNSDFKAELFMKNKVKCEQMPEQPEEETDLEDKIEEHINYQLQVGSIELFRLSLKSAWEKRLFEAYFKKGITTGSALAKHFNLPDSSADAILLKFRNRIREIYVANGGELGHWHNKPGTKKPPSKNNKKK